MNKYNRDKILILFFTLVIVMMGFGMVIPILPFYIERFDAGGSEMGMLMAVYALMQFLFAPLWGDLSDRWGRKPILVLGVLGNAASQWLFGMSESLTMLMIARALAGVLSSATLPTAMAYVGDITSDEERSAGMGMMGAAMGVGMVIGPGFAGWLAEEALALPFFLACGASMVAVMAIIIMLPESLPQAERAVQGGISGPRLGEMWRALAGPLAVPLVLAFVLAFGLSNFEGVFGLWALELFGYGPSRVGLIMTILGVAGAAMMGMATGPLAKRFGDVAVVRGSLAASAVGFVLMTQARDFTGVLGTALFFMVGNAMLRPAIATLASKRAPGGQGIAMGLNNSFMSLGRIAGPVWAGFAFDRAFNLPYVSGAVVMVIGFAVSVLWLSPVGSKRGQTESAAAEGVSAD